MDRVITEIDEITYLQGELMGDAIFKYCSPEIIDSYNTEFNAQGYLAAQKPGSFLEGLSIITNGLQALIVAKSVCDFGDTSKNNDYQSYAAHTSANFFYKFTQEYLYG